MSSANPPAPGFDLHIAAANGAVTARLVGELDLLTAPELEARLLDLFEGGARQLVLDLTTLSFIDSSGLSALVATLKRFRGAGGDVVLRSPRPATAKVLEISGLNQVFTIEDGETAQQGT